MTTNYDNLDAITEVARHQLGNRLHGLGRRAAQMDTQAVLDLHRHLDLFRDEQRARREALEAEAH